MARCFLFLKHYRTYQGILVNQHKFILDVLQVVDMISANPIAFPLSRHIILDHELGDLLFYPSFYLRLFRRLLYITISRPDIAYIVRRLSYFLSNHRATYLQALFHLL